ncbi:putative molybdopterin-dependent oxidoreductase [Burkholderia sp. Ch1-1]|uniref:Molybdopterin-dependent oxidoreductase n=1 Tax=Paraburkholderia dioscoreae TaxID=2604047 RepID=A0A5Q4ZJC0_9BURK|nr:MULTISPECIES: molybdopterin-dependent oxidoreductase [Paraburkholderia]EIF34579.1 putative molybdopterin-dependent oxidoreductase [Burkholderia sp. Ch1-1]MDR8395444.1 molybdopterin-dependent oxidoreductase [Paraburkholderia sp. USG1]VVD33525.1 Putative molybdopterin-dependent oxidoreductase [Paraburkholderia dioscoreae]
MNKRQFLSSAALLGASAAAAPAFGGQPVRKQACAASPVVLTISGAIRRHNRGALDPAFDQLLAKHQVKFSEAYGLDVPFIAGMPAVTIKPTTEYDSRPHALSGPLLTNVLEHVGAPTAGSTQIVMHAVDGYAVATTLDKVRAYKFIVATHMDGKPLPLGGVGPLWATYDADNIPELSGKPLKDRFELSPWGLYHLQVTGA